ncbi:hypothetical protein PV392_24515 [Streptomyces sp. ME03-5709C]|nr:hypothetical protein [Streptomyces sp. ME03-5709C]
MDSSTSSIPGSLPAGHLEHHRTFAELTGAYWTDPPIYTELLADWRARGLSVPGFARGDVLRATGGGAGSPPPHPPGTGPVPPM